LEDLNPSGGSYDVMVEEVQVVATPALASERYGHVDFYGYVPSCDGWLFCGWSPYVWQRRGGEAPTVILHFARGNATGKAVAVFYSRPDLNGMGEGVVLLVRSSGRALGELVSVEIRSPSRSFHLFPTGSVERLRDQDVIGRCRGILYSAEPGPDQVALINMLSRGGYAGRDTVPELAGQVFFALDEAILCPPQSVVLVGWLLAMPGTIEAMRLRSGPIATPIDIQSAIRTERRDVLTSVGAEYGFADLNCGFVVFVPEGISPGDATYIEIETTTGEIAYANLPVMKLRGLAAIKRVLSTFSTRYSEMQPAFDNIVGPAVTLLNQDRLQHRPSVATVDFGPQPESPVCSVIVPLYGRMDFLEYQFAFFSRSPTCRTHEYIYVLDQPEKRVELLNLAQSVYQRFKVPFRVLISSVNMGFAPANNIGLEAARGDFICYLNSDVFPGDDLWIDKLVDRFSENPDLGVVGPVLTFEDGTIQHQGLSYEPLAEFGNWLFCQHYGKGWRPTGETGLRDCVAITGACMVLPRALATEVGGFDEAYVIGDFEDSDLCLKLRQKGLRCCVDHDLKLYHLERQSQGSAADIARMNLTLYNAWLHQRRWGSMLAEGVFGAAVPDAAELSAAAE